MTYSYSTTAVIGPSISQTIVTTQSPGTVWNPVAFTASSTLAPTGVVNGVDYTATITNTTQTITFAFAANTLASAGSYTFSAILSYIDSATQVSCNEASKITVTVAACTSALTVAVSNQNYVLGSGTAS